MQALQILLYKLMDKQLKDLDNKVDGLKVRLHVNGWGATTIFVNGEKIY